MTKKKIDRLSVIHRREITWLKWYFLRDKKNPKKTVLEQMIHDSFMKNDTDQATFLVNLKLVTSEHVENSEEKLIETIKEVYVYENINVIGACQKILFLSPSPAYTHLNKWFDAYFYATYKYLPLER
ncbi:TPA: hypothetical protein U1W16_000534 [Streptococcus suis]|uniref:hypothetical protein n=1 Tax=Streptococcus suis TaxID=1307 RepID=UPI0004A351FA|nr:hypothetical protein [Streptococcus suis]HEL1741091.1 hypothetical protein [Streptococcus suis]HEL2353147.1 hypothetical protein [Streptococcus suis]HEM3171382.1 hypothetical protein [Streptococcus suis]HEM4063788.1 hypothetical protein [Streptococcus suis]HEM5157638.1 hypothetical protein [Streptococcus suis]